ncbi:MAG: sulfatase [Bacteroidetes bacterium]|nr:sulfatase [Bacteroidota bacterium]
MKNIFLFTLQLLMCIGFFSCTVGKEQKSNPESPNIVIIFTDDQGYGDVGCYGATGFETPNLDKLANQGIRFTNHYSAQPVCSASRAGLLTGCYPNRIGLSGALFPHHKIGLNPNEKTIAEMLKEKGYATAIYGKWHLGHHKKFLPLQHGFDEYVGVPYSNDMWPINLKGEKDSPGVGRGDYPPLPLVEGNETIEELNSYAAQDKLTTLFTEKAVDFINRNSENPFFLYVPHSMPHVPLGVSDKFRGKSEQGMYGDVMMEIDWSVGQIVEALKENGIEDNTLIIFTTDNGPWLNYGNHAGSSGGLREGKTTSWEGGQRVPFIIKWPGNTPEGLVCNKLSSTVDIFPSIAEIVNGDLPEHTIDGLNVTELWKGNFEAEPRKELWYYFHKNHLNAIRKGNWKLVFPHKYNSYHTLPGNDGRGSRRIPSTVDSLELYNMMRDPGEEYNVIELYPEILDELQEVAKRARAELGDLNVGIEAGIGNRPIGKLEEK